MLIGALEKQPRKLLTRLVCVPDVINRYGRRRFGPAKSWRACSSIIYGDAEKPKQQCRRVHVAQHQTVSMKSSSPTTAQFTDALVSVSALHRARAVNWTGMPLPAWFVLTRPARTAAIAIAFRRMTRRFMLAGGSSESDSGPPPALTNFAFGHGFASVFSSRLRLGLA
jgi:hypothetical protein